MWQTVASEQKTITQCKASRPLTLAPWKPGLGRVYREGEVGSGIPCIQTSHTGGMVSMELCQYKHRKRAGMPAVIILRCRPRNIRGVIELP